MQVRFTKSGDRRYGVAIERELGPALVPRSGPGADDLMPHDLAHYLVEEHFGIELGVWGQLAAGGGGIFSPAPEDDSLQHRRRSQRIGAIGRRDMARSEQLVMITISTWEQSIGRPRHQVPWIPIDVDAESLCSAVERVDEVSGRWQALQPGGSLTFVWPRHLTVDPSKTHRGRRQGRRTRSVARR
jgi:hypothetical protein